MGFPGQFFMKTNKNTRISLDSHKRPLNVVSVAIVKGGQVARKRALKAERRQSSSTPGYR